MLFEQVVLDKTSSCSGCMKKVSVQELSPGLIFSNGLYFTSGDLFLNSDRALSGEDFHLLKEAGISELWEVPNDEMEMFRYSCQYRPVKLGELRTEETLSRPIYDRRGTLLLEADIPLTEGILRAFRERNIREVYIAKNAEEIGRGPVMRYKTLRQKLEEDQKNLLFDSLFRAHTFEEENNRPPLAPEQLDAAHIDRSINASEIPLTVAPGEKPLLQEAAAHEPDAPRVQEVKLAYIEKYQQLHEATRTLFKAIHNGTAHPNTLTSICKDILNGLLSDRELLANLVHLRKHNEYLFGHSINVAILSSNIAATLGYDTKQILEISYAALLQDIGMLKIPREILDKSQKLTILERLEIEKHPSYNLGLLANMLQLPSVVPIVVYQAHERMDRSGYPKKRPGNLIHQYARIIAIADVFDALCSARPYRPAILPYKAMEHIIKQAAEGKLDKAAVRGLLKCQSLFPLGSWVELSDGHIGKVVAAGSGADYTRPVLRLLHNNDGPLPSPRTVHLEIEKQLKILRPIENAKFERTIMEGF